MVTFPHGGAAGVWPDNEDVDKAQARDWGGVVEQTLVQLEAASTGGARFYRDEQSDLAAISGAVSGDVAFVLQDPNNSGVYVYDGTTWSKEADLPPGYSGFTAGHLHAIGDITGLQVILDGLGTASTFDQGDFASAAQGGKADTAVQPGDIGTAAAADVEDFKAPAFEVPLIGLARHLIVDVSGNWVSAETQFGQADAAPWRVPMIGGYSEIAVSPFGAFVAGKRGAEYLSASGQLVEAMGNASVSGMAVPQVFVRRAERTFTQITAGPEGAELVSADTGAGTAVIRRAGRTQDVTYRVSPVGDGGTLHLCLSVGQSLTQGHIDAVAGDRSPPWRDPVHDRAFQFKAGDSIQRGPRPLQVAPTAGNKDTAVAASQLAAIEPLRGANHGYNETHGQTALETMSAALLGQHLHHRDVVLGAVVGTGSTAIADFESGSEHYQSCTAIIDAAATFASNMNKSLKVWLVWNQGRQDNTIGTTKSAWKTAWTGIRDELQAYVETTKGETFGGAIFQQCSDRPSGATGMSTLAQAELIASGEAMGVPTVAMRPGHSGQDHILPETYFPLGSACAYAIAEAHDGGALLVPPYVAGGAATLTTGTQIDCVVTGGSGVNVLDAASFGNRADGNFGVTVRDDDGALTVAGVILTGAASLRITLSDATSISKNPIVEFGLDGPADLSGDDFPRVCIRDDSAWRCIATGQIVSGWMIQHEVAVTA